MFDCGEKMSDSLAFECVSHTPQSLGGRPIESSEACVGAPGRIGTNSAWD